MSSNFTVLGEVDKDNAPLPPQNARRSKYHDTFSRKTMLTMADTGKVLLVGFQGDRKDIDKAIAAARAIARKTGVRLHAWISEDNPQVMCVEAYYENKRMKNLNRGASMNHEESEA